MNEKTRSNRPLEEKVQDLSCPINSYIVLISSGNIS